jgi:hypothetical protein
LASIGCHAKHAQLALQVAEHSHPSVVIRISRASPL